MAFDQVEMQILMLEIAIDWAIKRRIRLIEEGREFLVEEHWTSLVQHSLTAECHQTDGTVAKSLETSESGQSLW